ncbi:AFR107Wp [Eremothecium gossypii ATCC 10895]|uniref:AFR107Wp n=1 Tax=Eremothecium gossypii (strain ATCC 10895 / CBS 109.51 / FGSC 9923 / NRRL Y-1056) TaxID=284811 RepID=Q754G3_EREGS|nr:AFR107Wp [Eremothecium gossypii ATCC 10895]AAS53478.1 AFR107Wp [Eremothecium gossypii ATCC 10895]AEY97790.1 FAFR107Wp [Eremothecium gossypii FDAG1]
MAKATSAKKVSKKEMKKKEEAAAAAAAASSSSSSSSSESESGSSDESSDESSDSSSDNSSSSNSSSDSSSSDSSDSESSSSSDSDSSDSEEETKNSTSSSSSSDSEAEEKEKSASSKSSSSSSSESSSDSESSASDNEGSKEESKKRSAESEDDAVAKKQKTDGQPATIFVGRLSWSVDDEWLKTEFDHIGGVVGARVIYERGTDKSRGYGYVDFEDVSYAEKAVKEMHGKEIDGRAINCDMSTSKPASAPREDRAKKYGDTPSQPSDTLFLGNLSFNADRDALFELFSKHGNVISVRIPTHPESNQPKGFGYVQYGSVEEAQAALDALQGEYIDNRPVRIDFSSPRPPQQGGATRGRGGFRGGRGGGRTGSGANNAPLGKPRQSAAFKGTKKTFD